jgi:hypothetical protein
VEVNTGSENGQWVVIALTSPAVPECEVIEGLLPSLADKFADTKFLKIRSTAAIERWPDANLPTIFCYRDGEMQHQLLGHDACGGPCTSAARVEWRLKALGVLESSDMEKDVPRDRAKVTVTKTNNHMSENRMGGSKLETYGTSDDEDNYDE